MIHARKLHTQHVKKTNIYLHFSILRIIASQCCQYYKIKNHQFELKLCRDIIKIR